MMNLTPEERVYADAVGELVAAEVEEAESFLVRKHEVGGKVRSDWEARAMACIDTDAGVTKARGAVEIAKNRMQAGYLEPQVTSPSWSPTPLDRTNSRRTGPEETDREPLDLEDWRNRSAYEPD